MTCANTNLPSLIGPSRGLQTGRQDGPGRKSGRGRYRHHGEMTLPQYLSSTYCENAIQRWDTTDRTFQITAGYRRQPCSICVRWRTRIQMSGLSTRRLDKYLGNITVLSSTKSKIVKSGSGISDRP